MSIVPTTYPTLVKVLVAANFQEYKELSTREAELNHLIEEIKKIKPKEEVMSKLNAKEYPILSKIVTSDKVETHCYTTWQQGLQKVQEAQALFNQAMAIASSEQMPVEMKAELADFVATIYNVQATAEELFASLAEVDPGAPPLPQVPEVNAPKTESVIQANSVADKHQLKVLVDTVKNPAKALLGGPSVSEAIETLKKKFKYTEEQIKKLQGN